MFTGIVEERGSIRRLADGRLEVACDAVRDDSPIGASVAVNGVCLTVVDRPDGGLAFDLSEETIARSALSLLGSGAPVNLERPVSLAARLGGHVVQGHVDGLGVVAAIEHDDAGGARVRIAMPDDLRRYTVEKGSIAVDGVSLTVAEVHDDGVTIALIPHTLAVTTFGALSVKDPVNLEVDVLAKYVERLTSGATPAADGAVVIDAEGATHG
jgi:riboflavin synthase